MSNVTVSPTEVAVRHTPSIDTDAPTSKPSVDGIWIPKVTMESPLTESTQPVPCTIPVNIIHHLQDLPDVFVPIVNSEFYQ